MKLNNGTVNVLKSFSAINQGIVIQSGKVLRTTTQKRNIFGLATIADDFPVDFAIYDLPELLASVSLFKDPDIDFGEDNLTIKEGRAKIRYTYSSPKVISSPDPSKTVTLANHLFEFKLSKAEIQAFFKAAAVLKLEDLVVTKDGITASKDGTDNAYALTVDGIEGDSDKRLAVKIDNLKFILPLDYDVKVNDRAIQLSSADPDNGIASLSYFIALTA